MKDDSADAYESLIDRLLESKAYGEHRARYWLDAAPAMEIPHGLHLDNVREIWPYRDWVIGAYNENLPFDRFTVSRLRATSCRMRLRLSKWRQDSIAAT